MFFKEVGKFFSKTIPQVVTKDIPRIVTKDIPKIVTKDIPKVVTKDIPKVVTKDIPRIVTQDIPNAFGSVGKRETYAPELRRLREQVEGAETTLKQNRDGFFARKAEYAEQRKRYQRLSEDYARRFSDATAAQKVAYVPDKAWDDPSAGENETWRHVEKSFRHIVGFVTLGLGEAAWAAPEAKKEKAFLRKRLATLAGINLKLSQATHQLATAIAEMQDACERIRVELGAEDASDAGEALNARNLAAGVDEGKREVARAMLAAGASVEDVGMITELDPGEVQALVAEVARQPASTDVVISEEDRMQDARELLHEGVAVVEVAALTGLSNQQVEALMRV
ncbi:MAG: hypothetical protein KDJ27_08390 [Gammaproteobacteria bacterium]|nr:hypothetical protein [Gammaproteobacteria bacterium]